MSNQVAIHGQYSKEDLLKMSGQIVGGNQEFVANMYINRVIKDKAGNRVTPGVFCFASKEKDKDGNFVVLYAKEESVLLKPFIRVFRYEAYDAEANGGKGSNVGRSILFQDFKQEIISDNGYLKAGKGKIETDKCKVRCKIYIYGTVSGDFVKGDGEVVHVENQEVFIKLGGQNFFEYDKLFKEISKSGKLMFLYNLKLTPEQMDTGAFVANISWDNLTVEAPITDAVVATLEGFNSYIGMENKRVQNKWERIVNKAPKAGENDDPVVADEANDSLEFTPDDGQDIVDGD